jgi:hypothetical protein
MTMSNGRKQHEVFSNGELDLYKLHNFESSFFNYLMGIIVSNSNPRNKPPPYTRETPSRSPFTACVHFPEIECVCEGYEIQCPYLHYDHPRKSMGRV